MSQRPSVFSGTAFATLMAFLAIACFFVAPRQVEAADYTIYHGVNGGDCHPFLGDWNATSSTCTLNRDVHGSIEIRAVGVTLDGNGHSIVGAGINEGNGIAIFSFNVSYSNVTIKNVTISGWQTGIYLYRAYTTTIASSTIADNTVGIHIFDSPLLSMSDVSVSANRVGLTTSNSFSGLKLARVAFDGNDSGLNLNVFGYMAQDLRIDTSNTVNGKPIYHFENRSGETHENLGEIGMLMCQRCTNMTFGHFSINGDNGVYSAGLRFWGSDDNVVHHVVFNNVKVGASLSDSERNFFHDNTFNIVNHTPGEGQAIGVITGVLASDNNAFLDNNFIEPEPLTSATRAILSSNQNWRSVNHFYSPLLERGNYWSRYDSEAEGCGDFNDDRKCDFSFYLDDGGQYPIEIFYAWAYKNAWDTPTEPAAFWTEIANAPSGALSLRDAPNTSATILKQLPNAWALHITNTKSDEGQNVIAEGHRWYQVEDATDGTKGWMAAGAVDASGVFTETYLSYDTARQSELEDKATHEYATRAERTAKIFEAVTHYYENEDTIDSLFSSNNGTNNLSFFKTVAFPKELVLAIAAQESEVINFDNEWVRGANPPDLGHGIMQITSEDAFGSGSNVGISSCEQPNNRLDCYSPLVIDAPVYDGEAVIRTWPKQPYLAMKYYTNTSQGIYANIKDGMRTLQDKYHAIRGIVSDRWQVGGLIISLEDMKKILAVRGYNGFGPKCFRFNVAEGHEYLEDVAENLQNITDYFAGGVFHDSDSLVDKLREVERSKVSVNLCSPGTLQLVHADGRTAGPNENSIPNVFYNTETNQGAEIFLPEYSTTSFRVLGTEAGVYDFYIDTPITTIVAAKQIPLTLGAIHTFNVDQISVEQGRPVVTLTIDTDGDGAAEKTITTGSELSPDDITLQTETAVDLRPDSLNLKNDKGNVTAYIELPTGYDVGAIESATVAIQGVNASSIPASIGDYDEDGISDLMVKFDRGKITEKTVPQNHSVAIQVSGKVMVDGKSRMFTGSDIIKIIE